MAKAAKKTAGKGSVKKVMVRKTTRKPAGGKAGRKGPVKKAAAKKATRKVAA